MRLIWAGFPFRFAALRPVFGGKPMTRHRATSPVAMRLDWTNVPGAAVEPGFACDLNFRACRIFHGARRYRPGESLA